MLVIKKLVFVVLSFILSFIFLPKTVCTSSGILGFNPFHTKTCYSYFIPFSGYMMTQSYTLFDLIITFILTFTSVITFIKFRLVKRSIFLNFVIFILIWFFYRYLMSLIYINIPNDMWLYYPKII